MPKYVVESEGEVAIVPLKEYDAIRAEVESLRETIEILSNRKLMRDLDQAIRDHEEGKSIDLEEFWRKEMSEP
ncbi:MAG: hypothetical protein FJY67_11005 [Calditrichaeota bacterium]|nr:hypothetical protein [Calditrichota bacterium]